MIEIVFGYGTDGMLLQAGVPAETIYGFDLALSKGNLMEKPYPDLTELRIRADQGGNRSASGTAMTPMNCAVSSG